MQHCVLISFGFHGGARRQNVPPQKKRPRREQWIPSVIETKHEHHFCQASVLAFFTIPKASLTGEGSEKNSASRLKGQKKIKQNILNLMN